MTIAEQMPTAAAPIDAATRIAYRTCPLCEASCGLEITLRPTPAGDEVVRIRGDRDDVFSQGYICPKGSTLKQLHDDPDRLRQPLVKRDGVFVEVTWDDAFAEVERRLLPILERHGRDACAVYVGNPPRWAWPTVTMPSCGHGWGRCGCPSRSPTPSGPAW